MDPEEETLESQPRARGAQILPSTYLSERVVVLGVALSFQALVRNPLGVDEPQGVAPRSLPLEDQPHRLQYVRQSQGPLPRQAGDPSRLLRLHGLVLCRERGGTR